jgi:phage tail sheath gpL-like
MNTNTLRSPTDSNTLFDFEQEWGFEDTGRWGWMRQLYGHLFACQGGHYSEPHHLERRRNKASPRSVAIEPAASPTYEWASAYCAKAARGLTTESGQAAADVALNRMLAAQPHDRFHPARGSTACSGVGVATQEDRARRRHASCGRPQPIS